jgi:hypothetical protein
VLLGAAVTLPGTISPGFTVAASGLAASATRVAKVSGKTSLHQRDLDVPNQGQMVRPNVIRFSFFTETAAGQPSAVRSAAQKLPKGKRSAGSLWSIAAPAQEWAFESNSGKHESNLPLVTDGDRSHLSIG